MAVEYWQSRMNSTKSSAEGYFSSEFRLGASACYGFLSVVGIVGNVLVVAVVFRLKHMVSLIDATETSGGWVDGRYNVGCCR